MIRGTDRWKAAPGQTGVMGHASPITGIDLITSILQDYAPTMQHFANNKISAYRGGTEDRPILLAAQGSQFETRWRTNESQEKTASTSLKDFLARYNPMDSPLFKTKE